MRLDQHPQLALEPVDLTGQAADPRDLLASDPDPGSACGELAKAPSDSVEHPRLVQRAALERALELRTEFEQMPPQPVDHARTLDDEVVAMIKQQTDLHRLLIQIRGREAVDPVLDDRAGDRERVDLIRLARLTLPAPGRTHPVRRDA